MWFNIQLGFLSDHASQGPDRGQKSFISILKIRRVTHCPVVVLLNLVLTQSTQI